MKETVMSAGQPGGKEERGTRDGKGTEQFRVSPLHSVKIKVMLLVGAAIIFTIGLLLWAFIPLVEEEFDWETENYLYDLAEAYGKMLDKGIGSGVEPDQSFFQDAVGSAYITGVSSSYGYVVSRDGTMLYHPTEEKIGKPVENEVVAGVVQKLQNGEKPETAVVEYLFKGVIKYASYYVTENSEYILVITADREEIMQPLENMIKRSVEAGIVALLLCLALAYIVSEFIVRPIKRITKITYEISKLDFSEQGSQKKLSRKRDEIGAMSRAISRLRQELVHIVQDIKDYSDTLYSAAEKLNDNVADTASTMDQVGTTVQEIADGASNQASDTQRATENVIDMGSMIEESNTEMEKLRDHARGMRSASQEAAEILQELDGINRQAIEAIGVIYKQTNTTNESALKIQQATALITDIAEETNLLSLNASIEAARAGEQGRGFAVVAGQIQKLAEQSNDSAKQIADIIDSLLADSRKAVQTMDDVKLVMDKQSEDVSKTTDKFGEVTEGISRTIDSIREIAALTKRLDEARTKVVDIVQNLTAIAQENAASTEETSASVTEVGQTMLEVSESINRLKEIADDLDSTMKTFKL